MVCRRLANKVVPIFLGTNMGPRKVSHLRENQVISQQSRKHMVTHTPESVVPWSCSHQLFLSL